MQHPDEYHPTCRQVERRTDEEREAMARFCEELREARRQDAEAIKATLAANWPQQNKTPRE